MVNNVTNRNYGIPRKGIHKLVMLQPYSVKEVKQLRVQFSLVWLGSDTCKYFCRVAKQVW